LRDGNSVTPKKKILSLLDQTNILAEAYKVIIGLYDLTSDDRFYGIEKLLPKQALEYFWDEWPPHTAQEKNFAFCIRRSRLLYDIDKYAIIFKNLSEGLQGIKQCEIPPVSLRPVSLRKDRFIPNKAMEVCLDKSFAALSDIHFLAIECATINEVKTFAEVIATGGDEERYEKDADTVERRKDVLQLLIGQISLNLQEIKKIANEAEIVQTSRGAVR